MNEKVYVLDLFCYPENKLEFKTYEIDESLFYYLVEKKREHDIYLNIENHRNDIHEAIRLKDFEYKVFTDLNRQKYEYKLQVKNKILNYIEPTLMLDSFNFLICNNELISNGFYITHDNREEKYLEILQKDDNEALIELLEKYLISLDRLTKYNYHLEKLRGYEEELDNATSNDELTLIMMKINGDN